jgi:hypothetical protein
LSNAFAPNIVLHFRKRYPLSEDHLPWLLGPEEHPWTARRNTSGKGVVSAILVRALYVLVDRSGSMAYFEHAMRQDLMTIYLAAVQVGIPIGIAYFGEDDFRAILQIGRSFVRKVSSQSPIVSGI